METKKTKRGGVREGSGRPKGVTVNASITLRGTQQEIDLIKRKAEKTPISLSRYCIEILLSD